MVAKGADGPLVTCHRSPCVRTACMSAEPAATPVRLLDASHASSLACVFVLGMVLTAGAASPLWLVLALVVLMVAVATSVHHAEVIAARVGSSLGAIVLALVVTVIEVGLIVAAMASDTPESAVVARDTVFAALLIVVNGIIGVCLLVGGLRFRTVAFHAEGTSALLAVLAVLSGLTFVLPNFTTSAPTYGPLQLAVISAASLLLYAGLLFTQTRTHPGFFEDVEGEPAAHAVPTGAAAWLSFVGLLLGLGAVIGLAQTLAPAIAQGVSWLGAPRAAVGIVLALLVLAQRRGRPCLPLALDACRRASTWPSAPARPASRSHSQRSAASSSRPGARWCSVWMPRTSPFSRSPS